MREIPRITKNLLIINVICFLANSLLPAIGMDLNNMLGLHYVQATEFNIVQLFTYMFMHASLMHLFFNMFALWMFGGVIERTFGEKRFLIYYLVCGLGAAVCQELSQFAMVYSMIADQGASIGDMMRLSEADRVALNVFTTVGASGCVYGILLAFGMTYPEEKMFIFPLPVPIKAKWFVCGYVLIELWSAYSNSHGANDGVAHIAHLGGMLFGYILIKMWRKTSSSFNGWDGYEVKESKAASILGKIRQWLHLDRNSSDSYSRNTGSYSKRNSDWQYNAQRQQQEAQQQQQQQQAQPRQQPQQDEIDIILDKIRKSGYESLTEEEKKRLFNAKR